MTAKLAPTLTPASKERYGTFVGTIDQASASRLAHWLDGAAFDHSTHVHLAFQSSGGLVADGVFLYDLIRSYPVPLTIYNMGTVSSIAAIAYLGAKHRHVSKNATFMLHRTTFIFPTPPGAAELQRRAQTLVIDDQRTERILRAHLRPEWDRWNDLNSNDVWFTADEAVAAGMADAVADFSPPQGTELWDFNMAVQGVTP
jgi:ATP-dependent protease ClpP protease subunit